MDNELRTRLQKYQAALWRVVDSWRELEPLIADCPGAKQAISRHRADVGNIEDLNKLYAPRDADK